MISKDLTSKIENEIGQNIISTTQPPQGMGSSVWFATLEDLSEVAIKVSDENNNDATVLELLQKQNVTVAVPKLYANFQFDGSRVVVMQRIKATLLEDIKSEDMHLFIPSMIENQHTLHQVTNETAGFINSSLKYKSWKEFLLSFFNNQNPNLQWNEIVNRKVLDKNIVENALEKIRNEISQINEPPYFALLHADFNQRNLMVNERTHEIAAILDWGEAMFGDPLYDFARIRMLIWHFDLGEEVLKQYYDLLQYSAEQKERDTLYWICRIIEYLAYYSEEDNEFNNSRIELHQEFLENWSTSSIE